MGQNHDNHEEYDNDDFRQKFVLLWKTFFGTLGHSCETKTHQHSLYPDDADVDNVDDVVDDDDHHHKYHHNDNQYHHDHGQNHDHYYHGHPVNLLMERQTEQRQQFREKTQNDRLLGKHSDKMS